jgi:hypothetical protein
MFMCQTQKWYVGSSTSPPTTRLLKSPRRAGDDSILSIIGSGNATSYRVAAVCPSLRATAPPRITILLEMPAGSATIVVVAKRGSCGTIGHGIAGAKGWPQRSAPPPLAVGARALVSNRHHETVSGTVE